MNLCCVWLLELLWSLLLNDLNILVFLSVIFNLWLVKIHIVKSFRKLSMAPWNHPFSIVEWLIKYTSFHTFLIESLPSISHWSLQKLLCWHLVVAWIGYWLVWVLLSEARSWHNWTTICKRVLVWVHLSGYSSTVVLILDEFIRVVSEVLWLVQSVHSGVQRLIIQELRLIERHWLRFLVKLLLNLSWSCQ